MPPIDVVTRAWVDEVVGSEVVRADALVGGLSSRMHRCRLRDGRTIVVRHIADAGWLRRDPELIGREVIALRMLEAGQVPVPAVLAADARRGLLAMSYLPGRMIVAADELTERVDQLARVAAAIAATPRSDDHGLPPWQSWTDTDPRPPAWGSTALWSRAIDAFFAHGAPDVDTGVLLHRDLHPLNLLWDDASVVGVVDWTFACIGHPHAELSHCRWNLCVLAGLPVADEFLDHYLAATGSAPYSSWWDLATLLGLPSVEIGHAAYHAVGRDDLDHATIVRATEQMLAAALDRLA